MCRRGSKWLVRYRDLDGVARREELRTVEEACRIFGAWVDELRRSVDSQRVRGGSLLL